MSGTSPSEQHEVALVVEVAVTGGDDRAVAADVLGVGEHEVLAEQLERLRQDLVAGGRDRCP